MITADQTHSNPHQQPPRRHWRVIAGALGLSVCLVLGGCSSLPANPFELIPGFGQSSDAAQDPGDSQAANSNPTPPSYSATATDAAASQTVEPEAASASEAETATNPSSDQLTPIQSIRTGAYFDNLPPDLQEAYYVIGTAVENAQELVDINIALDNDSLNAVLTALQNDRPDLFWFPGSASGMAQNGSTSIRLTYTATGDELAAQQKAFNARVQEIVEQAQGLAPADQEKLVHDLLISQTSYIHDSQEKQGQSAYTALVEGRSVCAGYARAFKLLLDELGIPCVYVSGQALDAENGSAAAVIESQEGETATLPAENGSAPNNEEVWSSHAWCIVSLDDTWYNVDITWDDNNLLNEESILYTHFNEADSSFNKTHQRDENAAFLPTCSTTFDFEGAYGISRVQAAADALGVSVYATVDGAESYQAVLSDLAWNTPDFNCDFYLIVTDDTLLGELQNQWQDPIQDVYEQRGFSGVISFNSTAQQLQPGENLAHVVITAG